MNLQHDRPAVIYTVIWRNSVVSSWSWGNAALGLARETP